MHLLKDAGLQCTIAMPYNDNKTFCVGRDDGVVWYEYGWPAIALKLLFAQLILKSFAGLGCHPCMMGSYPTNGLWLPTCMDVRVPRSCNHSQWIVWSIVESSKTLPMHPGVLPIDHVTGHLLSRVCFRAIPRQLSSHYCMLPVAVDYCNTVSETQLW